MARSRDGSSHFWQEIFSALTMLVPSLYLAYRFARVAAGVLPLRLRYMNWATYLHCIASCMYHCQCALNSTNKDFNHFRSPLRTADLAMIHVCLVTYTHAVSGEFWIFDLIALALNFGSASLFVYRQLYSKPGSKADSFRAVGGISLYLGAMLWRRDLWNFLGVFCSYAVGGIFYHKNDALGKWGHGFFHLALVPCTHYVLKSSVAALGDACPALF
jgi:hypothetical protein|mmetsp:Transcript_17525/g.38652  ORF Transcript_17525/g.38652 Transcript_17525/m.38652 type:complete len:216 (+) Transcript_17525:86-733(+)